MALQAASAAYVNYKPPAGAIIFCSAVPFVHQDVIALLDHFLRLPKPQVACVLEAGLGFYEAFQMAKFVPLVIPGPSETGINFERPVVTRKCLVAATQAAQRIPFISAGPHSSLPVASCHRRRCCFSMISMVSFVSGVSNAIS